MSASITQATTPTITFVLPEGTDISDAAHIYATLRQGARILTKTGDQLAVSGGNVSFALTQAETLRFVRNEAIEAQLNWTYADGKRGCTKIVDLGCWRNLIPEVLPHE